MATADTKTLFATLKPAAERGGQLSICLWKEEEVHGDEIRQKGRVGNQPDGTGGEPVLGGGCMMTGKLFQQKISVKNGPDGKTIQARA